MKEQLTPITTNKQVILSRIFSLFSLCKRAGLLVSGESKCENAIKSKNAKLVFLSSDASKNTRKKFVNSSNYYKVPLFFLEADKVTLGSAVGDGQRSVIAIIDSGFAKQIESLMEKIELIGGGPIA